MAYSGTALPFLVKFKLQNEASFTLQPSKVATETFILRSYFVQNKCVRDTNNSRPPRGATSPQKGGGAPPHFGNICTRPIKLNSSFSKCVYSYYMKRKYFDPSFFSNVLLITVFAYVRRLNANILTTSVTHRVINKETSRISNM
jgi:hypothetical protein